MSKRYGVLESLDSKLNVIEIHSIPAFKKYLLTKFPACEVHQKTPAFTAVIFCLSSWNLILSLPHEGLICSNFSSSDDGQTSGTLPSRNGQVSQ